MTLPGGAQILAGQRDTGTRVPTLARVGGWKADVPSDPLSAEEGSPTVSGAGGTLACASYKPKGSGAIPHVACFALETGTRVFDVSLDGDAPLEGILVTDQTVYVSMWGALEARAAPTGQERWRFGTAF